MTDLEICIAIEQALGFEVELSCDQPSLDAVRNGERRPMIVYTADINAMLDAECVLKIFQRREFYTNLYTKKHPLDITARDRAEELLRTLGKWKEEQK